MPRLPPHRHKILHQRRGEDVEPAPRHLRRRQRRQSGGARQADHRLGSPRGHAHHGDWHGPCGCARHQVLAADCDVQWHRLRQRLRGGEGAGVAERARCPGHGGEALHIVCPGASPDTPDTVLQRGARVGEGHVGGHRVGPIQPHRIASVGKAGALHGALNRQVDLRGLLIDQQRGGRAPGCTQGGLVAGRQPQPHSRGVEGGQAPPQDARGFRNGGAPDVARVRACAQAGLRGHRAGLRFKERLPLRREGGVRGLGNDWEHGVTSAITAGGCVEEL
mmetsp:Transcript_71537/g.119818  ORF Transcript_71537/g.119818 Transcript_71537/m.119818 type:complete len:277 (-) Transcript_71537:194-1024(-)